MNRGLLLKGMLLVVGAVPSAWAQGRIDLDLTHWISKGLPSKSYWTVQPWAVDQPVHAFMDRALTLESSRFGVPLFFEWREQATLNTNQASLMLAIRERMGAGQLPNGTTALQGAFKLSRYEAIGVELQGRPQDSVQIRLRPKLLLIRQHMDYRATGELTRQGSQLQLAADVHRQSTRDLGLPGMQAQPVAGYGLSSDLRLQAQGAHWDAHLRMENLLTWIRPGTTNSSQRTYRVRTNDSQIELGREPSMTGVFGSQAYKLTLPRFGQASLALGGSGPAAVVGVRWIEQASLPFWGARLRHQGHELLLTHTQGGNSDLSWTLSGKDSDSWRLFAGMALSPDRKPALGQVGATLRF